MRRVIGIVLAVCMVVGGPAYVIADIYSNFFAVPPTFQKQSSTPAAPGTGRCKLYFKADNSPYYRCVGGSETAFGSGSGSGNGDMLKSDYDTNADNVVDSAASATTATNATHAVNADNATTATTATTASAANALSANGANCSAGQAPLGVNASGAVESCWTPQADLSLVKGTYTNGYLCTYTTSGTLLNCNTNPAGYQAADADLTTYAGITPSANVQSFLAAADYAAMRTALGLVIGTNVQAYDADLTTYAGITPSANVQTFLGSANTTAMRSNLGLVIGTNVQAYDADLTTWAGISPSTDIQSFMGAANNTAARTALGLGTAATLNVGTGANQIVQLDSSAKLPALDGSQLTGISAGAANSLVAQYIDWSSASGGNSIANKPTLGTAAAINVGTGANQIVQLNSSSKIPAIDGSLLTYVVAVSLSGQYVDWNASSGGNSIANKPSLGTAALLNVGTGANQIVQLNGSSQIPAVDGSLITGLTVSQVANSLAFSGSPTVGHLAQVGSGNTIVDGGTKVTDNASNSTYLYKDASGNIVSTTLGNGLLDSAGTLKAYVDIASFSFDGGGSAIAVNAIACRVVKYASTITSYTLSLDGTSNTTILVMGDTFSDTALPSTSIGNATTSAKRGKIDTTLTGWTTAVGANMELCANVTANTAAKKATLILHGTR